MEKKIFTIILSFFLFLNLSSQVSAQSCTTGETTCVSLSCSSPCIKVVTQQGGPGGRGGAVPASCACQMPANQTGTVPVGGECQQASDCVSSAPNCWSAPGQHPICRTLSQGQTLQQQNQTNSIPTADIHGNCGDTGINTAIGCIQFGDQNVFLGAILRWAIGIGGGIAFLLIVYAGFMIMTAAGNPERLKAGQELLTSAISGLILLILSVFVLKFIGVDILGLGSLGFSTQ